MTICLWSLRTQHSKTMKSHQKILKIDLGNTTQASTTIIISLWMEFVQKLTKYLMWHNYIRKSTFSIKYCTLSKRSLLHPIIFTNYRLQRHTSVSFEVIFSKGYLEDIFIFTSNECIFHLFKEDIEDWRRWRTNLISAQNYINAHT